MLLCLIVHTAVLLEYFVWLHIYLLFFAYPLFIAYLCLLCSLHASFSFLCVPCSVFSYVNACEYHSSVKHCLGLVCTCVLECGTGCYGLPF